jgi:anti-anti-sigma factor
MMEMLENRQSDVLVLALKGRLDAASTPSVQDRLRERIEQGERRLALDASGLTYISSCGLRLLLQAAKQFEGRSGRMVLCALQEPVMRVLKIAGFIPLFSIFGTAEEAVQHCQRD